MSKRMEDVCNTVLEKVTPKKRERMNIEALGRKLERKVAAACREFGVEAEVRVEGSVAKDTWLSREPDIDIFMRLPTSIPRMSLGEIALKVARKATKGSRQVERFAEHPYLEAFVNGVRVNIVPCYKAKSGEWLSATDRTPFHTDYIKKRLAERMKGDVRLLKKFLKGIDAYGAEIKVGGFSGYLCELLTLHYKSFANVLKAFARHKRRIAVDIEGYYEERERELQLLFKEPLAIIDPVDRGRNVASAVQAQKLFTFVAASRAFLKYPSEDFFYPKKIVPLSEDKLKRELAKRGLTLVFVVFGKVDAVPDVLWGQLYKSQRSLQKLIELNDFKVLRSQAWSDEKSLNMFIFELEEFRLPNVKKHLGPPLEKEDECENFLKKYINDPIVTSGPFISDGRWVVELPRKFADARVMLSEKLRDGGRNAGVAEQISHVLRKEFKVCVDEEIAAAYRRNQEFAKFLTGFLRGKPRWLKAC
jgi:tRNA nucleotidyltransferase (CCA-adding enzyme)